MNTPAVEHPETPRPRWMLVDDDVLNLTLLGKLLRANCEAEIECFQDGGAALAAFAAAPESFSFVVTDLEMPGMNGLELCRQMHALAPPARILLATGGSDMTAEDATRAGFCGLLRKPFLLGTLLEALAVAGQIEKR